MKKKFLLAVLVLTVGMVQAQRTTNSYNYKTALGVKVWDGAGVSLKHFFNTKNAGELIAYFPRHGFRLTGLYEIHGPITGAPGLKWYIGPGMHIGFYEDGYYRGRRHYHDHDAVVGIDGVIGLDYKFRGAPINVSLDWQPSFEFADDHGFSGSWGGLGIRYTF